MKAGCCSESCGLIYQMPPDRNWMGLVRCCMCDNVTVSVLFSKISSKSDSESLLECVWTLILCQKCVQRKKKKTQKNKLQSVPAQIIYLNPLQKQQLRSKFAIRDLSLQWTSEASWTPFLINNLILTWSPLRLKILESSMTSQDDLPFPFWFPLCSKAAKFRHFSGSLSTWRKLHHNLLIPFFVNKRPERDSQLEIL